MPALALTDHGVMHGYLEHYKTGKRKGIKPIIGCETYFAKRTMKDKEAKVDQGTYHMTMLAATNEGLNNLIQITSAAHRLGYYYKPRIDKEFLKEHAKGLIALSGCLQGEIPQTLLSGRWDEAKKLALFYEAIFGKGNFYIELQQHPGLEDSERLLPMLKKLSQDTGIPMVATADIHYVYPEDNLAQDALVCISTGKLIDEKNRMSYMGFNVSMRTEEEMCEHFADVPEALANTLKIAERCNVDIELGKTILPFFPVPEKETEESWFIKKCHQGMNWRYGNVWPEEARARLEYETKVILQMGYPSYFLIVQDFIMWAKGQEIGVGPGRGSAAGSIVAYVLGITNLDPLIHHLLFERFLNPERVSMPDIDTDIEDRRRGEVIKYVSLKYGADHVAQIITFGTLAARNAVRDVGRVLGMAYTDVDRIAKLIPEKTDLSGALDAVPELQALYGTDTVVKKLFDLSRRLEGNVRHASIHAAGIVISREPMTAYVPVMQATKGDAELVTQVDMNAIEDIGLLKMDFLGLANLSIIKDTVEIAEATQGVKLDIDSVSLDDPETFNLLAKAHTSGVFQLESAGMKRYLAELKPTKFGDITAMVALYRPGPLERIPDYVDRKHGRQEIKYLHPDLKDCLAETYGVLVYQEQVQEMAQKFSGFTLGQGYLLVKAVAKKKKNLLEEQKKKFIEGAINKGHKKELAEELFSFIEPFARYGFNRAHSAAYGYIAYQTSYLKAHFPAEFMAAWLRSEEGIIEKMAFALEECEHMGLKVLPPDVNRSFVDFGVVKNEQGVQEILFGLAAVKNVGRAASEAIVRERKKNDKYTSLTDFIERVGHQNINRKALEALAQTGALDRFADRGAILESIDEIVKFASSSAQDKSIGLSSLFGNDTPVEKRQIQLKSSEPMDVKQKLAFEKALLGMYISEHPLSHIERAVGDSATRIKDISQEFVGRRVRLIGVVGSAKKITTKSNQPMLFVKFEDTTGQTEVVVFPSILEETKNLWAEEKILVLEGRVNDKDGQIKILAEKVSEYIEGMELEPLAAGPKPYSKPITKSSPAPVYSPTQVLKLILPPTASHKTLKDLKDAIEVHKGNVPVVLMVPKEGGTKEIKAKASVDISPLLLRRLKQTLGDANVVVG